MEYSDKFVPMPAKTSSGRSSILSMIGNIQDMGKEAQKLLQGKKKLASNLQGEIMSSFSAIATGDCSFCYVNRVAFLEEGGDSYVEAYSLSRADLSLKRLEISVYVPEDIQDTPGILKTLEDMFSRLGLKGRAAHSGFESVDITVDLY